jgi:hypothetical protein
LLRLECRNKPRGAFKRLRLTCVQMIYTSSFLTDGSDFLREVALVLPLVEVFAKRVVYADSARHPTRSHKSWIKWSRHYASLGYRYSNDTGFQFAFYSFDKFDLLCFCGSNQWEDWVGNLSEIDVGSKMYEFNRSITSVAASQYRTTNPLFVSGHSLGAALAQHHYKREPAGNLVTFNSPVVSLVDGLPSSILHVQHLGDPIYRLSRLRAHAAKRSDLGLLRGYRLNYSASPSTPLVKVRRDGRLPNHSGLFTVSDLPFDLLVD